MSDERKPSEIAGDVVASCDRAAMKVSELIVALTALVESDPTVADLDVSADGCDCYGDAVEVRVQDGGRDGGRFVLVARE